MNAERVAALVGGVVSLVVVGWVGLGPGTTGWPALISAVVSVGAAAGLLGWLAGVPSPSKSKVWAWIWGAAACAVLAIGSALDYALWFTDSRWWTVACHALALVLVALAGISGGWVGGLRAAIVAHLGATMALLLIFRWNWGAPEQTAVFQAAGVLDAYEVSGGADFPGWVTDWFLNSLLPRTIGAVLAGAGLGAGAGWVWSRIKRG